MLQKWNNIINFGKIVVNKLYQYKYIMPLVFTGIYTLVKQPSVLQQNASKLLILLKKIYRRFLKIQQEEENMSTPNTPNTINTFLLSAYLTNNGIQNIYQNRTPDPDTSPVQNIDQNRTNQVDDQYECEINDKYLQNMCEIIAAHDSELSKYVKHLYGDLKPDIEKELNTHVGRETMYKETMGKNADELHILEEFLNNFSKID